jgi:hypothetical protein
MRCELCGDAGPLDELTVETRPENEVAFGRQLVVCRTCLSLLDQGLDSELSARLDESYFDFDDDILTLLRNRIVDRKPVSAPSSPVLTLLSSGYAPLHEHTGVDDILGPLWPNAQQVRAGDLDADLEVSWFGQSPWPGFTVEEVMQALWSFVQHDARHRPHARLSTRSHGAMANPDHPRRPAHQGPHSTSPRPTAGRMTSSTPLDVRAR